MSSSASATAQKAAAPFPPQDLEANTSVDSDKQNPETIAWEKNDANPRNWPSGTKWKYTCSVSLFTFISPVSSAMVAPALQQLSTDLHIKKDVEVQLALSIFILAYAVGPLFLGPASEVYGRKRLFQICNLWYLLWNMGCGFAKTPAQFFIFRFLSGLGGSAPLALGGGAISDVWDAEERGKAMGVFALCPILGPVLGPIAGGFVAEYSTWRWVFWASSMFAVLIQAVGFAWLRESYAPVVLQKLQKTQHKENPQGGAYTDTTTYSRVSLRQRTSTAMARPFRMLATQPIVAVIALYMGYLFGTMYLLYATFPSVWSGVYGESFAVGGLHSISFGLGSFFCTFFHPPPTQRTYQSLKQKNGGIGRPEFRTPTMAIGSLLVTIGLFWYGWSVQARLHWIMPNIGAFIFSAGVIGCFQGMQTYTVDAYTEHAASAIAACSILRSLAGFGFPLFAPYLYQDLGYGWGTSVLAFASVAIGIPAPLLFWRYGAALRAKSHYASG